MAATIDDVIRFVDSKKKPNTVASTRKDVRIFEKWLAVSRFELRPMDMIPPKELNEHLAVIFISIRKQDGSEYEPSSLTNMLYSFERHLSDNDYSCDDRSLSLLKDNEFKQTREALKAKRVDLRQQGKGQRPHKSKALSEAEENILWDKKIFGHHTPFSIQFTLFYHLTLTMGLRGRDEHRKMTWGDIVIRRSSDTDGKECLVMSERDTKTRDGACKDDMRKTEQMYYCECHFDATRCLIEIYKHFESRRPDEMFEPDSPFYLAHKLPNQITIGPKAVWYKKAPLGKNKLSGMLAEACEMAGIEKRTNHGVRATAVQRLRKAGVPDDKVIQITGRKTARSLVSYDKESLDTEEHLSCHSVLTGNNCHK